ncbi:MAG: response regulator [Calditrichaeota bacterium]|nr:MAG: response regulator [Calditrichota bacterium]
MEKLNIICVDDQSEVLATLRKNLEFFSEFFEITDCESAEEAWEEIEEIDSEGDFLALIVCDHVMPSKNGVEFLTEFYEDSRFPFTKKMLLTGLATHEDTISAINNAKIDCYIEKPWESAELIKTIQTLVTEFILEKGLEYQEMLPILDQQVVYRKLSGNS